MCFTRLAKRLFYGDERPQSPTGRGHAVCNKPALPLCAAALKRLIMNWGEVFSFNVSAFEIFVRGTLVYWFLFLLFRFVIRRDVGSLGIADVLFIVLVADASQNAMAGEYTSVSDGVVLVLTLAFWNIAVDWLAWRMPKFGRLFDSPPILLIRDGKVLHGAMRRQFVTLAELQNQLRLKGVDDLSVVRRAYMESDGDISVIRKDT
jgi:uncharacterized membrane protein YcaP (DUF421 family)